MFFTSIILRCSRKNTNLIEKKHLLCSLNKQGMPYGFTATLINKSEFMADSED